MSHGTEMRPRVIGPRSIRTAALGAALVLAAGAVPIPPLDLERMPLPNDRSQPE